jgi:hypothetical protein
VQKSVHCITNIKHAQSLARVQVGIEFRLTLKYTSVATETNKPIFTCDLHAVYFSRSQIVADPTPKKQRVKNARKKRHISGRRVGVHEESDLTEHLIQPMATREVQFPGTD